MRVVARAAREVRRERMIGAGQRAPRNAVAVDVVVAAPLALQLRELLGGEHLAALDRLGRILERIGHPVVHAEVEIAQDEDRRLELLGEIERLAARTRSTPTTLDGISTMCCVSPCERYAT